MKSVSVHVRMSMEEKSKVKSKSEKAHLNLSAYLITSALNKEIKTIDGLPELVEQIKRIGNNVNQIARIANTNSAINKETVEQVNSSLMQIDKKLIVIIKGLI